MNRRTAWLIALGTMIVLLVIDQSSKIWVKTHMEMGEEFSIFGLEWARIHFVENEGMAFGMSFGGATGKLLLSLFRIVAVTFLFFLLYRMIDGDEHLPSVVSFSMILAGASGNILDSMFYGLIFSASPYHGGVAELFPDGGGYAPFLMGKVVDMFYFPLFTIDLPAWVPIWGGGPFEFFRPVFNVADASIFCGICTFLLFYKKPKPDSGASPASEG